MQFNPGDKVQLNPIVLEEDPRKNNHHLYERILKENREGTVVRLDNSYEWFGEDCFWVKFNYATILLSEKHFHLLKEGW